MKKEENSFEDIEALIEKWREEGSSIGQIFFSFFKASIYVIATRRCSLNKKLQMLERATNGAKKIIESSHSAVEE